MRTGVGKLIADADCSAAIKIATEWRDTSDVSTILSQLLRKTTMSLLNG